MDSMELPLNLVSNLLIFAAQGLSALQAEGHYRALSRSLFGGPFLESARNFSGP